ncbi:M23 family metallopeptidase [Microaerobacter geothermalis]|uniref:M23 family metallopeptidase n=1 Tax=Microaerobacter geothermalis TaxID=674972 RepID=UPI001F2B6D25|nr:M23 family metallopeptidase [Microaerobacter geothermalis]MCF6094063.1 M23 family metallopeptidase [Microaerobacter geothermalis]
MKSVQRFVISSAVIAGIGLSANSLQGKAEARPADTPQYQKAIAREAVFRYFNPFMDLKQKITKPKEVQLTYKVKPGDNLTFIAKRYRVPVEKIIEMNQLENPNLIRVGQSLKIPVNSEVYTVQREDTLYSIAESRGVEVEELIENNPELKIVANRLYYGQELVIPRNKPEPIRQPYSSRKIGVTIASRSREGAARNQLPSFSWPITGTITSGFGIRWGRLHTGLDIWNQNEDKTIVKAARSGTVVQSSFNRGGYGNLIIIDHGGGIETYYAHMGKLLVKEGDYVNVGQSLGYVGNTGDTTGYHLHFEIRVNQAPINPLPYLP